MTLHKPLWQQQTGTDPDIEYSAADDRILWGIVFNTEGVGNSFPPNLDLKVTQRGAGANFSVDVAPGVAIILGDDVAGQGYYAVWSDATENLVVPSPPASGTRIHRVIARVRDKLHDGTQTTYDWVLEVLADSDGSGPPSLPASAVSLATVTVVSTATSVLDASIADTRQNAAVGSGSVRSRQVGADSQRPAVPWPSEKIWRTDKGYEEVWDGTAWRVLGPPPEPKQVESAATIAGFTGTSYAAGPVGSTCGTTFTASSTGRVYVTLSGRVSSAANGEQSFLSYEIRTGTTVGSGTVAQATSDNRALITSRAVNTGAASYLSASRRVLVEGLTGGGDYNIRTMHRVTGGQGTVDYRSLLIEPA